MSRPRLIGLLLALATLVVYLPVIHDDFLCYDDDNYVVENSAVQNGLTWAGVKWAFTTFFATNWHPVTWLSHMADCQLFGLNPGAHHFVNVLFHAANVCLLFFLFWRLTQKIWPSALVAALFAWHPLHVESVAWVSERKDVLSTFFGLLALLSYARFAKENHRRSYWFALGFFSLGLLAKPMLVTLPFVLLLLDFWPLQRLSPDRFRWPLVVEKAPFFVLAAASCVVTFFAQKEAMSALETLPLFFRLENSMLAGLDYLWALFWPVNLAIIYPVARISIPAFVTATAVLVIISTAAWLARKRSPCWLVGWLWFLGTLIPVIGLVQVGSAARADRYTYIPSIGIFVALAFGLNELAARWHWPKKALSAGIGGLLLVCVLLTEGQLRYWRNSESLFRHAIAVTQSNDVAHDNLGVALERQGRFAGALAEYAESFRLNPNEHQLHFAMGNMLEKMGRLDEALAEYQLCASHFQKIPAIHDAIGRVLAGQGKSEEALREFAEAEQLDAHYAAPCLETAKILFGQGHGAGAIVALQAAAHAEPQSVPILVTIAHYLAANQDSAARDGPGALVLAMKANDLSSGNDPEVLDVLGMALAETGDFTNALTCAQASLELVETTNLTGAASIRQRIAGYQNHRPWRESFTATNLPAND